jgi:hypothetical protein
MAPVPSTHTACSGNIHVRKQIHHFLTTQPFFALLLTDVLFFLLHANPGGGLPISQNRTKWPVNGGAVAVQPGWFQGHATAFFYINMGFGETPANMSFPMVPAFQIVGPTKDPYPGTFCLPQVSLPANTTVQKGDLATIQFIETAVHGAALYNVRLPPPISHPLSLYSFPPPFPPLHIYLSLKPRGIVPHSTQNLIFPSLQCVDIEFADPSEVAEVNEQNCFNSSDISFQLVFSTAALSGAAAAPSPFPSSSHWSALLLPSILVALVGSLA